MAAAAAAFAQPLQVTLYITQVVVAEAVKVGVMLVMLLLAAVKAVFQLMTILGVTVLMDLLVLAVVEAVVLNLLAVAQLAAQAVLE
jgi:hypothetical protein